MFPNNGAIVVHVNCLRSPILAAVAVISFLFPHCSGAQSTQDNRARQFAIQYALIWTGHLDAVANGRFGPRTHRAIAAWQTSHGFAPTGTLDAKQLSALFADANAVRDGVFLWSTFTSGYWGYSIGYPRAYFRSVTETASGAKFSSPFPDYEFQTHVVRALSDVEYADLFASMLKAFGDTVVFSANNSDYFVITGKTNRSGRERYYYIRLDRRNDYAVSFSVAIPISADARWKRAITAMSSSFSVPAVPARQESLQTPSILRPDAAHPESPTGILLRDGSNQTELSAERLYAEVAGSVYTIYSLNSSTKRANQGSAVAISRNLLLTNCHVLVGDTHWLVSSANERISATIHSAHRDKDRCVLRAQTLLKQFVAIRRFESIRIGERVYAIGAPMGLEATLTDGLVSGRRQADGIRYIQTSAPISKGSSGGGLFDRFGNLVAITTLYLRDSQNLNFAIAAEDFLR